MEELKWLFKVMDLL